MNYMTFKKPCDDFLVFYWLSLTSLTGLCYIMFTGKTTAGKLELYFSVFSDGESSMSFTGSANCTVCSLFENLTQY